MCRIPTSSSLRNRKLPIVSFIVFASFREALRSRPWGGFLPLDFALDFLLQLGRQIGFENLPAEALHTLLDLSPSLRICTTEHDQAGCTGLQFRLQVADELVRNSVIRELAYEPTG